jgi:hypothetical protein
MEVKERRLAVSTCSPVPRTNHSWFLKPYIGCRYEQKLEEAKRQLGLSEAKLVDLKKNVESVREKVSIISCLTSLFNRVQCLFSPGSQISERRIRF